MREKKMREKKIVLRRTATHLLFHEFSFPLPFPSCSLSFLALRLVVAIIQADDHWPSAPLSNESIGTWTTTRSPLTT